MAEGVGFEPTIRYNRIPDFESGAFDHSATLPCGSLSYFEGRILTKDWRFCTSLTKFFVASINRTVLRKQPPPSSEKSVGHTSRKKRGNQRSFANTVDRTEKEQTHHDGHCYKKHVDCRADCAERSAEAMHDSDHKTFRRQHQQTGKDHRRNTEPGKTRTQENLHESPAVVGRIHKAREPHGNVKHRTEKGANGQLLHCFDQKILRVNQTLKHKKENVREKHKQAHGKSGLATQNNSSGTHSTGTESCMGHGGDPQSEHDQAKKKNKNS